MFLSLWIVIFAMLGAYLVGWLKFQEDEIGGNINKPMPVVCILIGMLSFAFSVNTLKIQIAKIQKILNSHFFCIFAASNNN